MLLASLALALLAVPQTAVKESKGDDTPKVWDNLGVMRRVLVRQIEARRDKIWTNPAPKGEDGDGRADVGKGADGDESVAKAFLDARTLSSFSSFDGSLSTDAEYVPGLAAVFSLSVPVKVELVETEPSKDDGRKPSETKNADDEAWDRVARGEDGGWENQIRVLGGKGVKARNEPHREFRYDDAAVKALKETLFDTVARFGSKLGCAHGERIVVVARLSAGSVVNAPAAKGDIPEAKGAADNDVWRANRYGQTAVLYNALNGAAPGQVRRLVMQVSADDVRAFKNGDLERDELLKKTRFDEFNSAAAPTGLQYSVVNTAK